MALIAVKGAMATCLDTLSAAANVTAEGSPVGVVGDKAGGSVSASQSTVTVGGKYVLLKGDSVASHGSNEPHTAPGIKIESTPNSTVTIG